MAINCNALYRQHSNSISVFFIAPNQAPKRFFYLYYFLFFQLNWYSNWLHTIIYCHKNIRLWKKKKKNEIQYRPPRGYNMKKKILSLVSHDETNRRIWNMKTKTIQKFFQHVIQFSHMPSMWFEIENISQTIRFFGTARSGTFVCWFIWNKCHAAENIYLERCWSRAGTRLLKEKKRRSASFFSSFSAFLSSCPERLPYRRPRERRCKPHRVTAKAKKETEINLHRLRNTKYINAFAITVEQKLSLKFGWKIAEGKKQQKI